MGNITKFQNFVRIILLLMVFMMLLNLATSCFFHLFLYGFVWNYAIRKHNALIFSSFNSCTMNYNHLDMSLFSNNLKRLANTETKILRYSSVLRNENGVGKFKCYSLKNLTTCFTQIFYFYKNLILKRASPLSFKYFINRPLDAPFIIRHVRLV